MRFVRIGLLGYGTVGKAVVRACARGRDRLRARGYDLSVTHALVRDPRRARGTGGGPVLLGDPDTFFGHGGDVIVEVLGGVEPARTLIARALDGGTPVVTANKSVVAAEGEALRWLAARAGTCLRLEACALAGVPFIGALDRRPLASALTRVSAILNGTTNFILSTVERDHLPFDEALRRAQALGLAEPDPASDVRGVDAAEKLALLIGHFAARGVRPDAIETAGIDALEPGDLAQAAALGGAIKPVACATFGGEFVSAFVGPAFVPARHPLATVSGRLNAIALDGQFVGDLFFSGPGAGPDVTAATILDDVVECAARPAGSIESTAPAGARPLAACQAPVTPWFLRVRFADGRAPEPESFREWLAAHGVRLARTAPLARDGPCETLRALARTCPRPELEGVLREVHDTTGADTLALRVLEN